MKRGKKQIKKNKHRGIGGGAKRVQAAGDPFKIRSGVYLVRSDYTYVSQCSHTHLYRFMYDDVQSFADNGGYSYYDSEYNFDAWGYSLTGSDCNEYGEWVEISPGEELTTTNDDFFAAACGYEVTYNWYGGDNVFFVISYDKALDRALSAFFLLALMANQL